MGGIKRTVISNKNIEQIIFLKYNEVDNSYLFINSLEENPFVYLFYSGSNDIFFTGSRLTEYIRDQTIQAVIRYCRKLEWSTEDSNIKLLSNLDWFDFLKLFDDDMSFRIRFNNFRAKYNFSLSKLPHSERVRFNEGEAGFINYVLNNNLI